MISAPKFHLATKIKYKQYMKVLVTGSAGFIGFYLTQKLLNEGYTVIGIDNINNYYDINLKYARLAESGIYAPEESDHSGGKARDYREIEFGESVTSITNPNYRFIRLNLEDKNEIENLFVEEKFDYVINLAAQAGVRYSIKNPDAYIQSNVVGFLNILEACRHNPVKHFIYASSSSVYGANAKIPFSEDDQVDNPVSLYAATKKSNELMAHTYSHLYAIPTTGLRFFTVYGPWGRPDMAPMLFANAITQGEAIKVFNNGEMERDFTYIDDIVEGIYRLLNKPTNITTADTYKSSPIGQDRRGSSYYQLLNIGNGKPVNLLAFIKTMEEALDITAKKIMLPMQDGDVQRTWANVDQLLTITNYCPKTNIKTGIKQFVDWYKQLKS
jgi:UDP-glucuronate 4-epimerase